MDKEGFLKALKAAGFVCSLKDGVPTVHSMNKKDISTVKKLAKDSEYIESFGIVFDGGNVVEDDSESVSDQEENVAEALEDTLDNGVSEDATPVEDTEKELSSNVPDDQSFYSEPNIFDMFDGFD